MKSRESHLVMDCNAVAESHLFVPNAVEAGARGEEGHLEVGLTFKVGFSSSLSPSSFVSWSGSCKTKRVCLRY